MVGRFGVLRAYQSCVGWRHSAIHNGTRDYDAIATGEYKLDGRQKLEVAREELRGKTEPSFLQLLPQIFVIFIQVCIAIGIQALACQEKQVL